MVMLLRQLILPVLAALLVSCGGGDGFGTGTTGTSGSSGGTTAGVATASLKLLVSSPDLASDGSTTVTLTALIRDANNNVVPGSTITFGATSGSVKVTSGVTNADGVATATLSTGGDPTNRTITVTAADASAKLTATQTVRVTGTTLAVSGNNKIDMGKVTALTVFLADAGGNGIPNQVITIASNLGNTLSATTVTTNSAGTVTVNVTATVAGTDAITVSALGATGSFSLVVAAPGTTSYGFATPSTTEPAIGAALPVSACWTEAGVPQVGKSITFAATRGVFASSGTSSATVLTAGSGCASDSISSTIAGIAVVSAESTTGLIDTLTLEFVATTVTSVKLQGSPAVVSAGQKSTVTATVRDASNNLVKNKTVYFSITQDPTSGTLTPASGITNSFGQISTVYTAGSVSSGKNDVIVKAVVGGTAVTDSTTLTATSKALHVALGTGNTMSNYSDTVYKLPYSAIVTNSAGAPVANQTVSLTIWSYRYKKGNHYAQYDASGNFVKWGNTPPQDFLPVATAPDGTVDTGVVVTCANEDIDRNGVLDLAVDSDVNGNGKLEPGNVATIGGKTTTVITTNSEGVAEFDVLYPEEYAYWLEVEMEARVGVDGTEDLARARFLLPGLSEDYTSEKIAPPGATSPFGRGYDESTDTVLGCGVDEF